MYSLSVVFVYGLILSFFLALIGMYLIPRGLAFLADILGHAYLGAYITFSLFFSKMADLSSLVIAYLMAREGMREDREGGTNMMLYYIFFTVLLLGVVSIFSPEALNMVVFGNILSINAYKLIILSMTVIVWLGITIKYRKEILLSIINKEFSMSVYDGVNIKEFWFLFFSLLILMHAISVFGILLTAAITLLPYLTSSLYTKGLRNSMMLAIIFSLSSYVISFFISLRYDVSLSVAFSSISLLFYVLSYFSLYFLRAAAMSPLKRG